MKKHLQLLIIFMTGMLYTAISHAESVYFVQSANAKIWLNSSFASKVIAEVGKGQRLISTGQQGRWIKVNFDGKEGYIPSLLLSTHPPLKRPMIVKAEDAEIRQGVRRRTSSFTSAAAARGLTKEDRERGDIEEGVDFNALHKMEALTFTDNEITQFMEGGKL
ncbi:MAG: SH3 domain-containing protein [Gallionellaceae bacterium]|nr:SH3 domain-containing protein [Gallionellaceae bacterium]